MTIDTPEIDQLLGRIAENQRGVVERLNAIGETAKRIEHHFRENAILQTKPLQCKLGLLFFGPTPSLPTRRLYFQQSLDGTTKPFLESPVVIRASVGLEGLTEFLNLVAEGDL